MIGLDKYIHYFLCGRKLWELLKSPDILSANLVQKTKSAVSPYFKANDFAFAYALA